LKLYSHPCGCFLVLDVRTSAHRCPRPARPRDSLFDIHSFTRKQCRQTVKLTHHHRAETLDVRYTKVRRSYDRTARISLQILAISKSARQNLQEAPLTCLAQPASGASVFFRLALRSVSLRRSVRPAVRLSAAGEGVSTVGVGDPQGLFSGDMHFFRWFRKNACLSGTCPKKFLFKWDFHTLRPGLSARLSNVDCCLRLGLSPHVVATTAGSTKGAWRPIRSRSRGRSSPPASRSSTA